MTTIAPSRRLGYSDLYLDFVAGHDGAATFYPGRSGAEIARQIDQRSFDRPRLVEILRRQNQRYEADGRAISSLESLADQQTLCVFAGQQAGLFGGAYLSLVKAFGIVKAAHRFTDELGRSVIPIFWIAGDDHDFAEANHTYLMGRSGDLVRVAYDAEPDRDAPTGRIQLDDTAALEQAKATLRDTLGSTDFTNDLYDAVERSYRPGVTMVEAFGHFMAWLTRGTGLVFFSPADPEAKALARPFFHAVLDHQEAIHQRTTESNAAIERAGYHLQVHKDPNHTHLFYDCYGRKPVLRSGTALTCDNRTLTLDDIRSEIDRTPESFSPDVMLRPVFQSWLFPVLSQHGGPAEIAYLAQLNPLFDLFDRPAPIHRQRPTVSLIEPRIRQLMDDYSVSFDDLLGDFEQTINRVLADSFPADLDLEAEELKADVRSRIEHFIAESLRFDSGLQTFAEQTKGKIDHLLKQFEGKLFATHKKKSQQTRDRLYRISSALYPERTLQERVMNISMFIAKYGYRVVDQLRDQLDVTTADHQLLTILPGDDQ